MQRLGYRKFTVNWRWKVLIILGRRGRVGVVQTPAEESVRNHLGVILASNGFANSERMSRFLRYTVEMKLRGEEAQIKEFVLGQEVFDRGPEYDPRLDPIVRVEARRLRQRLAEYYDGPGKAEAVRIAFPKGSYVPVIAYLAAGRVGRRREWVAGLLAVAGLFLGVYWFSIPRDVELAVVPARWVWGSNEELDGADEGMAEVITGQLANQGRVRVIGWPVIAKLGGGGNRDVRVVGRELGVREVAVVSVRRMGRELRVTVFRLDALSGRKRFVRDFYGSDLGNLGARERLAGEITWAIAGR